MSVLNCLTFHKVVLGRCLRYGGIFNDYFIANLLLCQGKNFENRSITDEVKKLRNLAAYFFVPPSVIQSSDSCLQEVLVGRRSRNVMYVFSVWVHNGVSRVY